MRITVLWDKLRRVDDLDPFGRTMVRDAEDYREDMVREANRQAFSSDEVGAVRYYPPDVDPLPTWAADDLQLPPEAFSPDEPQVSRFVMKATRNDKSPGT